MATPATPNNMLVQTANRQVLVSWDASVGASHYLVQRSLDNITFTQVADITGSPLATSYLDTTVVASTQYWYQVAATDGTNISIYTDSQSVIPVPTGEMCLAQIRLAAQQRADRVGSNFVSQTEWRQYINQSMFELYDLLVDTYEDYFLAQPVSFKTQGANGIYPLPDGQLTFLDGLNTSVSIVAEPLYKLRGVDVGISLNSSGYVNVPRFNYNDRNKYLFPNTANTLYGGYQLMYRMISHDKIQFIPSPVSGQTIRLWYIPRLKELLNETDTTTQGISGWIEYVIVKAAYYALTKEESDTTPLVGQLGALTKRIEEAASNQDAGTPNTITDRRRSSWGMGNGWGNGWNDPGMY